MGGRRSWRKGEALQAAAGGRGIEGSERRGRFVVADRSLSLKGCGSYVEGYFYCSRGSGGSGRIFEETADFYL